MTSAAECAALAPTVTAHASKANNAGSLKDGLQAALAARIMTDIGNGVSNATYSSAVCTQCAAQMTVEYILGRRRRAHGAAATHRAASVHQSRGGGMTTATAAAILNNLSPCQLSELVGLLSTPRDWRMRCAGSFSLCPCR
jgi:hypothetical protein